MWKAYALPYVVTFLSKGGTGDRKPHPPLAYAGSDGSLSAEDFGQHGVDFRVGSHHDVSLLDKGFVDLGLGVVRLQGGVDRGSHLGRLGVIADAKGVDRLGDVSDNGGRGRTLGQRADKSLQVGDMIISSTMTAMCLEI